MHQFIVIFGNPVDGFTFIGAFDASDEAITWAEENVASDSWWIAELEAPE